MSIDETRVLSIGWPCDLKQATLLDTTYLPEFDAIILYPQNLLAELRGGRNYALANQIARIEERLEELDTWVSAGHTLIVITGPIDPVAVEGARPSFDLEKNPLFSVAELIKASGTRVECCGPKEANSVLEGFLPHLRYDVVLKGAKLRGLMRVHLAQAGPEQIVAGYVRHEKGIIIFVPDVSSNTARQVYALALAQLPATLTESGRVERPDWVSQLWTNDEVRAREVICDAKAKIVALENEIADEEINIADANRLKELFFATGERFQMAVGLALKELGLSVVDGPHSRADIISFDGVTLAAIEAKGLEGWAREFHLRQVDTWKGEVQQTLSATALERKGNSILSSYANQLETLGIKLADGADIDIDCKGIMVIGTYRLIPLFDRKGEDFPAPVIAKIKLSRVCALSGLQLYNLVMQSRIDRGSSKEQIRRSLFDTEGILAMGRQWQTHLTKVSYPEPPRILEP